MNKALIIYGSTTGNTEILAGFLEEELLKVGMMVVVKDVLQATPREMLDYNMILLGCSTWGEGSLQDDFIPFFNSMDEVSLHNKKAASFGTGDSSYGFFCEAVDLIETKLRELGADILLPGLKIDGDIMAQEYKARSWADQLVNIFTRT